MEDRLTQKEQTLFDSLSKEKMPPKNLEEQIINELKKKNLIKKNIMKTSKRRTWIIGIAASVLLFVVGYIAGGSSSSDITSGYVLLLHEDENFQPVGSEIEIFTKYATWMGKMALSGVSITGKELSPESTSWLSDVNNTSAINYGKDKISGYFIIDINDQAEAEKIALSSPHIKFGGTVELIKLSDSN